MICRGECRAKKLSKSTMFSNKALKLGEKQGENTQSLRIQGCKTIKLGNSRI